MSIYIRSIVTIPTTPIEETLAALTDLVNQGKTRYIGASSMYAWEFAKFLCTAEAHGYARFVTMQNHYNLVYREEEREMIPLKALQVKLDRGEIEAMEEPYQPHPILGID